MVLPPTLYLYYTFSPSTPVEPYNALFNLETLEIIEGDLPNRATKMLVEWATIYQP
jgi:hypothetical protein